MLSMAGLRWVQGAIKDQRELDVEVELLIHRDQSKNKVQGVEGLSKYMLRSIIVTLRLDRGLYKLTRL
jgi:hypothetical protein